MQVADFLEADVAPAARAFCAALTCRNRAAPPTWALLKAESPHIRDAVLQHHPVLAARQQSLDDQLAALPKCLGLRAVCAKRTGTNSDALLLNNGCRTVNLALPALLPALTELREVRMCPDFRGRASVVGAGWTALAAAVAQSLTGLTHLMLVCGVTEASESAFSLLTNLTALETLGIVFTRSRTAVLNRKFAPALARLTQLRNAQITGCGAYKESPTDAMLGAVLHDDDGGGSDACVRIAWALAGLTLLTRLELNSWQVDPTEACAIASSLCSLSGLRGVELACIDVSDDGTGTAAGAMHRIAAAVAALSLTRLNLWATVRHFSSAAMTRMLSGLTALRRLNLGAMGGKSMPVAGGGAQVGSFAAALRNLSQLEFLEVSADETMDQAAGHVARLTALTCLRCGNDSSGGRGAGMGGVPMAIPGGSRIAEFVADAAPGLAALRQLDLAMAMIDDFDMEILACGLSQLTGLQLLQLQEHRMCARGMGALATALTQMPDLRHLDVGMLTGGTHTCGPDAVSALAPGLAAATRLRRLRISDAGLRAADVAALAPQLTSLQSLLTLDIAGSRLSSEDAVPAIISLLHVLPALEILDLSDSSISDASFARLLRDAQAVWPDVVPPGEPSRGLFRQPGGWRDNAAEDKVGAALDTVEGPDSNI